MDMRCLPCKQGRVSNELLLTFILHIGPFPWFMPPWDEWSIVWWWSCEE
jgi:hypothetical protein